MKDLGNRIKENYEDRFRIKLVRRTPVIIRIDGKAFHTFTKGLHKPFDVNLLNIMNSCAMYLCEEIQGAKLAYIQSDEISILLTDFDTLQTEAWFDNNLQKIVSVSASMMTAKFNLLWEMACSDLENFSAPEYIRPALFDSRAFSIPKEEVANYFLWRALDWRRNSVSMYANSVFSHKQLQNKSTKDQVDMLFKKGYNWESLTEREKCGTFVSLTNERWKVQYIEPKFDSIDSLVYCYLDSTGSCTTSLEDRLDVKEARKALARYEASDGHTISLDEAEVITNLPSAFSMPRRPDK